MNIELPCGQMAAVNVVSGIGNDFQITNNVPIATGGFAAVYKGIRKSDKTKVAIRISRFNPKRYGDPDVDFFKTLFNEFACADKLKKNPHKNIVPCLFAGVDLDQLCSYHAMEYCNSGTVENLISSHCMESGLPTTESLEICYQVADGLNHLHSLNITHRDIKIDNILVHKLSSGEKIYKITDFNLSSIKKNLKTCNIGNVYFKAPELLNEHPSYTNKIDIWGLGITLHNMLFGKLPFPDKDEETYEKEVKENNYKYPQEEAKKKGLNPKIEPLLVGMLDKNPELRPSPKQVMEKINEINLVYFNSFDKYSTISYANMEDWICHGSRGIVKRNTLKDQTAFVMDKKGNLKKIDLSQNKLVQEKKFNLTACFGSSANSIAINKSGNNLLLTEWESKNIYYVSSNDLQTLKYWENTHSDELTSITFIDENNFCAGYEDGMLKKFHVNNENCMGQLPTNKGVIGSLFLFNESEDLLVGSGNGTVFWVKCKDFPSIFLQNTIHNNRILNFCKLNENFISASVDNSFIVFKTSNSIEVIHRYQISSELSQIESTFFNTNILVMCKSKFILYKNDEDNLKQVDEIEFRDSALCSFIIMNNDNLIFGDRKGQLHCMKLLENSKQQQLIK